MKVHEANEMFAPGGTQDELTCPKLRDHSEPEIRQWNAQKHATILYLLRKNINVLFHYMKPHRRNKPSAFSLRAGNGEPTSEWYWDREISNFVYRLSRFECFLSRKFCERQPLTDKNKTDPGDLGKSLDPVYQSVNP
ncbi:hypothetical protein T265_09963 [Opisthorchis viverrini]|uniref:Uncharacterized protein n=1 Tax=Opisthorchis viverrini TaxID=6198 RepID=A0A074Z893_OPIVI|nr:hypothetical protein T265_09963 [Opisthorchis viverrini]KER21777.1 hypothetical protein T265_09963 [Opisthorchis viverrini]